MRSHRRREPLEHLLIAGHADDVDEIRAALAVVSADTYGQVLVQAPAGAPLRLTAPVRMTIHCVDGVTASLTGAIAGWVSEWMPDELDPHRRLTVRIATHASSHVDVTRHGLDRLVERL